MDLELGYDSSIGLKILKGEKRVSQRDGRSPVTSRRSTFSWHPFKDASLAWE